MSELTKVRWHALNRQQILEVLQTRTGGLTQTDANERLATYGFNEIKESKRISRTAIFAKQLKEPLILMLLAATTISAFVGELVDAIIIIAIIVITAIVGFVQCLQRGSCIRK